MKQPNENNRPPLIFDHTDFQTYLKEFYEFRKRIDANYSFRRFSAAAGLNSPNYLKLIMDAERTLTVANIHRFAKALELDRTETSYFEALVLMQQAETKSERSYYQSRCTQIRKSDLGKTVRVATGTSLLEDPETTAVIVCVDNQPTETGATQISKKAGVAVEKVKRILETLNREKLIEVTDGRYSLSGAYLLFQDRLAKSSNQKRYIRSQLDRSMRALETRYARDAKFFCNTFTMEADALPALQERIAQWIDELMHQTNEQRADRVVQFNLQLFPFC
jgi:uncharacterized protein (TIGR02147 family)